MKIKDILPVLRTKLGEIVDLTQVRSDDDLSKKLEDLSNTHINLLNRLSDYDAFYERLVSLLISQSIIDSNNINDKALVADKLDKYLSSNTEKLTHIKKCVESMMEKDDTVQTGVTKLFNRFMMERKSREDLEANFKAAVESQVASVKQSLDKAMSMITPVTSIIKDAISLPDKDKSTKRLLAELALGSIKNLIRKELSKMKKEVDK